MTSAAELLGEIFEITRGDLESARFPFVDPSAYLRGMVAVRLARLSQFWKQEDVEQPALLRQSAEAFAAGLYGQRSPWLFLLHGQARGIHCWFATDRQSLDRASLVALVRGSFPEAILPDEELPSQALAGLGHCVVLTGTPSTRGEDDASRLGDQLERLCRGLYGSRWVYTVAASPIHAAETARRINSISEKIKDAQAKYLLKASPIDEEDRTAQRYVELLEAKLKRFEQGRISGMWDVRCALYADQPSLLPRAVHLLQSAFSGDGSLPDPIRVRPCSVEAGVEPGVEPLTSGEVAALARPLREDYPGYEITEYARFGVEPSPGAIEGAIAVGEILDRGTGTGNWLTIPDEDLTKHGLIVGITGSGKTNSCFSLLDQVWDAGRGVPFLVIESAKSEYRALLELPRFKGLLVFTLGDDTMSPFRLNPFEVPSGILVQTHIDYVKSLFLAAFVLYPPMPYVLEQSIQEIYEDRGWDIARNTNSRGANTPRCHPTLDDLAAKVAVVVDRMGYEQRITMDVKAGLLARINQLRLGGGKGLMLNTRRSVSESVLFESPCLLELKQIVSDDEKAFIIGLVLIRLHEYHESRQRRGSGLVHLTLIEEAHRLLRNTSTEQGGDVTANPKGHAIEVFANMLSEIRAYGEGILVAEQIPTKLAPDVVKNTGFKLIHRLVSQEDRALVGAAVNLDERQLRYLATLKTGEAIAWTECTRKAVLVQVPLSNAKVTPAVPDGNLTFGLPGLGRGDEDLLLPYSGCRSCTSSGSAHCAGVSRGDINGLLVDAFRQVFNAMRINTRAAAVTFAEFRQLAQRGARPVAQSHAYCTFVQIAESDLERRGEFRNWSFPELEWLIASVCAIAAKMASSPSVAESVNDFAGSQQEAAGFRERIMRLEAVESLPFPGCVRCGAPCVYRYDMDQTGRTDGGREFRSAFLDQHAGTERMVEIARQSAAKCFFADDHESIAGASFCYSVQQLAKQELALSQYYQGEMAAALWKLSMSRG